MKIKKFHIYLADLNPRFGTEPGKFRPVVVIQTDLLNNVHPSTVICPVTTNIINEVSFLRVHLSKKGTNLVKDSDILVDQVRSIDNRRLIKRVGKLPAFINDKIKENLGIVLDLE